MLNLRQAARLLFAVPIILSAGTAAADDQPAKLFNPFAVSTPAQSRPQYFAGAAWSPAAKAWLVVWQDGVPTDDGTEGEGRAQDILAARISADGAVLDARPIEICTVKGSQQRPVVASDGTDFMVIWHDLRSGKDWDLYAARVSGQGKVLDKDGQLLVGGEHNQCFADLVYGGGNYYVAWLDMRHFPEYRVYGSRVAASSARMLDGRGTELIRMLSDDQLAKWRAEPMSSGYNGRGWHKYIQQPGPPTLATNGRTHLVAAIEQRGPSTYQPAVYRLRAVDAAGGQAKQEWQKRSLIMDKTPKGGPTGHYYSRLCAAATADRFLLGVHLFEGGFGVGTTTFWATAQCASDGTPSAEKWTEPHFAGYQPNVKGNFRPTYTDTTGGLSFPPGYRTYGVRPITLDLAWDGKRGLLVGERPSCTKAEPNNWDVLAFFIDAEGQRLSDPAAGVAIGPDVYLGGGKLDKLRLAPIRIADGPTTQTSPATAAGPDGRFLIVWQEENPTTDSRIMARLVGVK